MPEELTNRLHFRTNAATILKFIQSKRKEDDSPGCFSLNSIRLMPDPLKLQVDRHIQRLSLMNSDVSVFDDAVRKVVLSHSGKKIPEKMPESEIQAAIEKIRQSLRSPETDHDLQKAALQSLERAVSNFEQYKYFSSVDWRFAHWGTIEDIRWVDESSFELPTNSIEFKTTWTPPIAAVEFLANTFPSVRFELFYRYTPDEPWTKKEFFPIVPFGY